MKGMFLRVGIDTGSGNNALSPIFEDGTFEYIPIPEGSPSREQRTYGTEKSKNKLGKKLGYKVYSDFVPPSLKEDKIHFDPEFDTYTYGDPTKNKPASLLRLNKDDYLFFYAGLKPCETRKYKRGNYLIGYFKVKKVIKFSNLNRTELKEAKKLCSNNAHIKRKDNEFDSLVIVKGHNNSSSLLHQAILISRKVNNHYYFLPKFSNLLENKPKRNEPPRSCQRAVAQQLTEKGTEKILSIIDI